MFSPPATATTKEQSNTDASDWNWEVSINLPECFHMNYDIRIYIPILWSNDKLINRTGYLILFKSIVFI